MHTVYEMLVMFTLLACLLSIMVFQWAGESPDEVNQERVPSPSDVEDYVANYFNSQRQGTGQEVIWNYL